MSQTKAQLIDNLVSPITGALGSASAPTFSFTADPNTGIYSPGADQLAVTTGGTGRLFIDSSGRLLAGTSTARSNFFGTTLSSITQIEGTGGAGGRGALSVINNDVSNNPPYVLLGRSGAATLGSNAAVVNGSRLGTLTFHGADGTSFIEAATVAGEVDGTPGTNDMPGRLVFSTTADGAASPTERLRIDSSGRVGVGTSSPAARLHISDLTATEIELMRLQVNLTSPSGNKSITWADSTNVVGRISLDYTSPAAKMRFGSLYNSGYQTSDLMTLTSTGLGIGTSAPQSIFHIGAFAPANAGVKAYTALANSYEGFLFDYYYNTSANNRRVFDVVALGAGAGGAIGGSDLRFLTVPASATGTPLEAMRIDSAQRVGIGTTSPASQFNVVSSSAPAVILQNPVASGYTSLRLYNDQNSSGRALEIYYGGSTYSGGENGNIVTTGAYPLVLATNNTERLRIDSSGRLLVGTSSALASAFGTISPRFQVATTLSGPVSFFSYANDAFGTRLDLSKSRGASVGTNTVVADGDDLGDIYFNGADGTNFIPAALIRCEVDGTPGANDMPGRLVFSTTADGASSPTERMRIHSDGSVTMGTADLSGILSGGFALYSNASSDNHLRVDNTNSSFNNGTIYISTVNASTGTSFDYMGLYKGTDKDFGLGGDGTGRCDGSWTGGGADYAEYFEWSDSNPDEEDRRGISVVLDGEKIREAVAGEDPIGVISGNPSVVGDAAWNKWSGKFLRDDYGSYIYDEQDAVCDDGSTIKKQVKILNPAYDPNVEYIPREQRPEWDCVGLMGKLRIRKGQVTGSRWIKMRDISDSVEEWLVH